MGPFFIVASHPFMGDLADFVERFEHPGIQDLGAIRSVEALNECVLIRLAGLNKAQFDPLAFAPVGKILRSEFRAIVQANRLWQPTPGFKFSSARTTRSAGRLVSISMASASRTPSSRMLSVLKRRPWYKLSLMKSSAQIWFGRLGASSGCIGLINRFFVRRGRLSFIAQYTRQVRL
jgi:hypothetical protein